MKTLTYTRGPSRRRFTPEDGVSRPLEFQRGVPQQVTDADAARIQEIAPRRFTVADAPEPAVRSPRSPRPPLAPRDDAPPTTGTTTTPKEG